jgi:hypothetical protein
LGYDGKSFLSQKGKGRGGSLSRRRPERDFVRDGEIDLLEKLEFFAKMHVQQQPATTLTCHPQFYTLSERRQNAK